jgi:hypothetical protein
MKTNTDSTQPVSRPRKAITIHGHRELLLSVDSLLKAQHRKNPKTRAPRSISQLLERTAIQLIKEQGRAHGIRLPNDLIAD